MIILLYVLIFSPFTIALPCLPHSPRRRSPTIGLHLPRPILYSSYKIVGRSPVILSTWFLPLSHSRQRPAAKLLVKKPPKPNTSLGVIQARSPAYTHISDNIPPHMLCYTDGCAMDHLSSYVGFIQQSALRVPAGLVFPYRTHSTNACGR
jgi:hypothetical protein